MNLRVANVWCVSISSAGFALLKWTVGRTRDIFWKLAKNDEFIYIKGFIFGEKVEKLLTT